MVDPSLPWVVVLLEVEAAVVVVLRALKKYPTAQPAARPRDNHIWSRDVWGTGQKGMADVWFTRKIKLPHLLTVATAVAVARPSAGRYFA